METSKSSLSQLDSGTLHALTDLIGFHYNSGIDKSLYVTPIKVFLFKTATCDMPEWVNINTPLDKIISYVSEECRKEPRRYDLTPMPSNPGENNIYAHWLKDNIDDAEFKYDV